MIQASRVLIFEPSTGLKAPAERARLYFMITATLGANSYEFTDADFESRVILDSTVDMIAQNRANVKPDKLPWLALRTLLSQCIYGGKIDNDFDQVLLDILLDKLFTSNSFDADLILIENIGGNALNMPDETNSKYGLINWVINIKALQKPNCIGLSNNAEKMLIAERGQEFIRKMIKVSDDELAYEADDLERNKQAPTWMVQFSGQCKSWLDALPQQLQRLRRTKENVRDPWAGYVHTYHKNGGRTINIKAFTLTDLRAIGVLCEADEIKLTDEVHVGVPRLQFAWTLEKHSPSSVVVPVYLYSNGQNFCSDFICYQFDLIILC
ncbi:hypothetical protein niasHS_003963 [Heterodera schachtii]|uniref:Dynein heavy chain AAA lid domain-containing protein n=1 Tax=Heterodera schachtii TaxID=97005 RepID=A0ABD2K3P8_HETSC